MKRFILLLNLVSLPASLLAQQAEVAGYVKDPSGSAISGASVTIINVDRGQKRTTSSNNDGIYSITGLESGKYEIHVEKTGFQTLVRSEITLQSGDKMQLDFEMSLGVTAQVVTVTAEKKEERIQDTPVPVTVLNADDLANIGQARLQDYYASVPGLAVTPSYLGLTYIAIRGITSGGTANPAVGLTIDDVPFGSATTSSPVPPDLDPSDLAEVEILRGPQGTLYGANSMGGLIRYVTKDPSTEGFSGHIEVGTNGVYNGAEPGFNIRASANIPLSDTFAIRVSAFERQDAGYIDNVVTGQKAVNDIQNAGARLSALWKPSDALTVKFSALYQTSSTNGVSEVQVRPGLGDLQQSYIPGTGYSSKPVQGYSASLRYMMGKFQLTSVTGYTDYRDTTYADFSAIAGYSSVATKYFGVSGADYYAHWLNQKVSQEVRLSGLIAPRLDLLVGGYYTHENSPATYYGYADNPTTGQIAGQFLYSSLPGYYQEYAGFADLTYHATDQFDVQIGARESHDTVTFGTQTNQGLYYGTASGVPVQGIISNANAFTYLVTPEYKFSPDVMVYARFASGYRPGGPNPAASAAQGAPASYAPDRTQNYEVGAKLDSLNHRLTFDASLYYINWNDIQFHVQNNGITYNATGGRAKREGGELSIAARPRSGMTVAGWLEYDDAAITQPPAGATVYLYSGDRLPYTSRFSGRISLDQECRLWAGVKGFVGVSASFVGQREGIFQPTAPRQIFPAYTKTDLHAGVKYDDWAVNIYANNVADVRGLIDGGIGYTAGPNSFVYIQPRTVGLSLSRTF